MDRVIVPTGRDDVAVLEIGGTHVTVALVDTRTWQVRPGTVHRRPLDAHASADRIIAELGAAANTLPVPAGSDWGVAIPGPFDYRLGIARHHGVGKFEALHGHDVRAALLAGITATPGSIAFVDDAEAFLAGEWLTGAAAGVNRCVALTVGTGIGSGFLADRDLVSDGPTVPPGGRLHRVQVDGRDLEDLVSRRAILRAYGAAVPAGGPDVREVAAAARAYGAAVPVGGPDVREIAAAARAGDVAAGRVLAEAFRILGRAIAPWLLAFDAELLVIGGSIAGSWDLMAGPLGDGLAAGHAGRVTVTRGRHLETSPLVGAAWAARRTSAC